MSRRRQLQTEAAVSLFPFLAVLICTMGTLIVLLVVVVEQARGVNSPPVATATATPMPAPMSIAVDLPPPAPPVASEAAIRQLEDIRWANQLLAKSRDETLHDLEKRRGDLSRIEDQTRTLSGQLDRLELQAQALLDAEGERFAPSEKSKVELENLRAKILDAKKRLAAKQAEAAKQRQQYAIIPYRGPNNTLRRPVYIECLPDGVVIQPEGIRFGAKDFSVFGSENPLAATLRAYREYLSNAGLVETGGEPYPLMIVRPNGERAYSACRRVMRSWDDEFGYELVPDDMELAYPEKDGGLAAFLESAVADARSRLPGGYVESSGNGTTGPTLGGPRGTGNGRVGGNSAGGSQPARTPSQGMAGGSLAGTEVDAGKAPTYALGQGLGGGLVRESTGTGVDFGEDRRPARGLQSGTSSRRRRFGEMVSKAGGAQGSSGAYSSQNDSTGSPSGASTSQNRSTASAKSNQGNTSLAAGGVAGGTSAAGAVSASGQTAATGSNGEARPGAWSADAASHTSATSSPQIPGSEDVISPGAAVEGGTSQMVGAQPQQSSASFTKVFAETQGVDWALPNAANGSIGISRPISASLAPQGIVLQTERGNVEVPIGGESVVQSVEPLVAKIWQVIDGWGIAGAGVHWKPTVHVQVQPGAEMLFEELQVVMQDSGLEIKRR